MSLIGTLNTFYNNTMMYFNVNMHRDEDLVKSVSKKMYGDTITAASTESGMVFDIETYNQLNQLLLIPETRIKLYEAYNLMDERYQDVSMALDLYCLSGDTVIPSIDGNNYTMKELVDKNIKEVWIYAYDKKENRIIPAKAINPHVSGKNADTYKIRLDDGTEIKATEEHIFFLREGEEVRLKNLKVGDSLMPLYRESRDDKEFMRGYEQIIQPTGKYEFTHRVSTEKYLGEVEKGNVVHHLDYNCKNNTPENLSIMLKEAHYKLHSETGRQNLIKYNKSQWEGKEGERRKESVRKSMYVKLDKYKEVWKKHKADNCIKLVEKGLNCHYGENNCKYRERITFEELLNTSIKFIDTKTVSDFIDSIRSYYNCGEFYIFEIIKEEGFEGKYAFLNFFNFVKYGIEFSVVDKIKDCVINSLEFKVLINYFNDRKGKSYNCLNSYRVNEGHLNKVADSFGYSSFKEAMNKEKINHKIVSIESVGKEEKVYDMTVPGYNNFAAGDDKGFVIVHNSDEAVSLNLETQTPIWVQSEDEQVANNLNALFLDTLGWRDSTYLNIITRNACKYGDNYQEKVIDEDRGLIKVKELPEKSILVKFDIMGNVLGYIQNFVYSSYTNAQVDFEPWQIHHLKIPGKMTSAIYGSSLLFDAITPIKKLEAIELAALLSRLSGAVDRYIFKIPVGKKAQPEAKQYINEIKQYLRRKRIINTEDGEFKSANDVMSAVEDLFIPQRESGSIEIDQLNKKGSMQDYSGDIDYFHKKEVASLKVPTQFLSMEDAMDSGKSPANVDLRFARRVRKVQNVVKKFATDCADTHLKYVWYGKSAPFEVLMNSVSQLEEQQALEAMELRYNLAGTMMDLVPDEFIYTNILKFPEEEAKEIIKKMEKEKKDKTVQEATNDAHATVAAAEIEGEVEEGATESKWTGQLNKLYLSNNTFRRSVDNLIEITKEKRALKVALEKKENPNNKKTYIMSPGNNRSNGNNGSRKK